MGSSQLVFVLVLVLSFSFVNSFYLKVGMHVIIETTEKSGKKFITCSGYNDEEVPEGKQKVFNCTEKGQTMRGQGDMLFYETIKTPSTFQFEQFGGKFIFKNKTEIYIDRGLAIGGKLIPGINPVPITLTLPANSVIETGSDMNVDSNSLLQFDIGANSRLILNKNSIFKTKSGFGGGGKKSNRTLRSSAFVHAKNTLIISQTQLNMESGSKILAGYLDFNDPVGINMSDKSCTIVTKKGDLRLHLKKRPGKIVLGQVCVEGLLSVNIHGASVKWNLSEIGFVKGAEVNVRGIKVFGAGEEDKSLRPKEIKMNKTLVCDSQMAEPKNHKSGDVAPLATKLLPLIFCVILSLI